jgi:hypothetical protein
MPNPAAMRRNHLFTPKRCQFGRGGFNCGCGISRPAFGGEKTMSANLVCFLIGIPLVAVWLRGVKRGVMLGLIFGWVRRCEAPARFWLATIIYGALAGGLLVAPSLVWLGLRS